MRRVWTLGQGIRELGHGIQGLIAFPLGSAEAFDTRSRLALARLIAAPLLSSKVNEMESAVMDLNATRAASGAFCEERVEITGRSVGHLNGLSFAAKDNFDVQGFVTGVGNPDWKRTHAPATATSPVIQRLTDAGATLVGKTQMDELAYGTLGENKHFGTPRNPAAPGRVPGGSSSGSAAAVAARDVDFALGTDSACSVRLPAALCGLYGIRPTFGRVSLKGVVPLSPSLDTVGWMTRTPELLFSVASILLDPWRGGYTPIARLCVPEDAFALAEPRVAAALRPSIAELAGLVGAFARMRIAPQGAEEDLSRLWFRVWSVQVREVWAQHGDWIEKTEPNSSVLTRKNLETGANSTPEELKAARAAWSEWHGRVLKHVENGSILCLPTTAGIAPCLGVQSERDAFVRPSLSLLSIAGIAGLPQVTLPLARVDNCPVGLSLVGPPGTDEQLIILAIYLSMVPDGW
jgi:amidase